MKRVDRLALPKELRPGRQFDAAEAQARQKWLRTGPETNRANVRARAAIMRRMQPKERFETTAQRLQREQVEERRLERERLRRVRPEQ